MAIPGLLRELGIEPAALLRSVGLDPAALDRSDNRVNFVQAVHLLNLCVHKSGRRDFGLAVGRSWRLEYMGRIGALMAQTSTVGSALQTYIDHQRQDSQGVAAWLNEYTATAEFGFATFHPNVEQVSAVYDLVLAALVAIIDELCRRRWTPVEVHLPHAAPADDRPFRSFLRCKVTFDSDRAAVRFPRTVLNWPVLAADPVRNRTPEIGNLDEEDEALLPDLYRALRVAILNGEPAMAAMAEQFGVHHRTLNRRLHRHGVTFREVLSDVRYEVARSMLRDSRRSVTEISATLGYSDDSAFVRAFTRWSGTSPGQWRIANSPLPE